jgi:hypothetical protein
VVSELIDKALTQAHEKSGALSGSTFTALGALRSLKTICRQCVYA